MFGNADSNHIDDFGHITEQANHLFHGYFSLSDTVPRAGRNVSVPVTGSFSTNEASIIVRAALSGTGVSRLPHFAAAQAIKDGRLVRLFAEHRIKPIGIHAVYLSRQRMPNALKALIDFLSTRLAD